MVISNWGSLGHPIKRLFFLLAMNPLLHWANIGQLLTGYRQCFLRSWPVPESSTLWVKSFRVCYTLNAEAYTIKILQGGTQEIEFMRRPSRGKRGVGSGTAIREAQGRGEGEEQGKEAKGRWVPQGLEFWREFVEDGACCDREVWWAAST